MKHSFRIMMCAAIAGALVSCERKEIETPEAADLVVPEGYHVQELISRSEATKTNRDDNGSTVWSPDDRITVFWDSGNCSADCVRGEDSGTATFRAVIPDGTTIIYASYPESINAELSVATEEIEVEIGREQPGSFSAGNVAVAKADGNVLNFFNVNAFLCFEIPGDDITKVVAESVSGAALAGKQVVSFAGENPALGAQGDPSSSITMSVNGGGKYYMSILPGVQHASGILLKYYKGDDISGTYYLDKDITTVRNKIYAFGEFEPDGNYYVTVSGAGNKNGMSWENAFSSDQMWKKLQLAGTDAATDDAKIAAIDGATFHMGAGTYNFGATPLLSFDETNPVVLTFKGGYPSAGGTQDLTAAGNRACFSGAGAHAALILRGKIDVTLEGINIVNGLTSDDEAETDSGSTLKVAAALDAIGSDVSITMNYCDVRDNGHEDNGNWGAGIRLNGTASFEADHVVFEDNAGPAPALSIRDTDATLTDCEFLNNESSVESAGAVYINGGTNTITSCTFTGNTSAKSGGAVLQDGAGTTSTFTDCVFSDNTAADLGGAVTCIQGKVNMFGGSFSANQAPKGGAIAINKIGDSNPGLTINKNSSKKTQFIGNSATTGGGAIWGNTQSNSSDQNVHIYNVVFKGNYAPSGGAFYVEGKKTGFYVNDSEFGGGQEGEPNYSTGNSGSTGGGTAVLTGQSYCTLTNCTITGDHSKRYGGSVYSNNTGNLIVENCIFNGCYSSSGWGGAIYTSNVTLDQLTIKGGAFIDCHSNCGGAILVNHKGKFDVTAWKGAGTLFEGNYADHATNIYQGGAISIEGESSVSDGASNLHVYIWMASFIGNHSGKGGAIYSPSGGKPDIYIDRCSFDGNYITKRWGPVIATDGCYRFHMNNCTIRNSYTTSSDGQPDWPSWLCIDGFPADGVASISNSTIIGNVQYSADGSSFTPLTTDEAGALVAFWGSQPNYLINNIIVPNSASVTAVCGTGSETVDLYYNQLGTVSNMVQTDSGGNVTGRTASSFDGLAWTSGLWQWSGTIGGSAPSKITASNFISRLTSINSAYVDWLATPDIRYDYRGVDRGADESRWWPGAYQD